MSVAGAQQNESHARAIPRAAAFWLVAGVVVLSLFAGTAPSPLYRIYQAQFRFSAITLTAIFAVYALAVLVTLLLFGTLSDYLGRRPVIAAALAVNVGACALFLTANGVDLLFAARVLQGIAIGLGTGALGAALIDLQPASGGLGSVVNSAGTSTGLATGALGTSALVQYGPVPTHLVWWLLLGALAVALAGIVAMPESAVRKAGVAASLRPQVTVPPRARGAFAITAPCLIAVWALGGFDLSLGPSLAVQVLRSPNILWGGVTIFLLTGVGAVSAVTFRTVDRSRVMFAGCLFLLAGTIVILSAIVTTTGATFLAGTAVAGVGFGAAFLGAFRRLGALANPDERAGLVAAIYVVNYLAFSIPALIAGGAVTHYGLHRTALVYCAVIAALASGAAVMLRRHPHRRAPTTVGAEIEMPPGPCTVPPPV